MLTLHEFLIDGDHAWVTANKNVPKNLSKYGGAYNGALIDSAVQEYDLKTGKLLRNWDALEAHPAERVDRLAADQRLPLGRLPRQLDPARRPGNVPGLDAQHLGRLPRRHRQRPDRVDARRPQLDFTFGRGAAFEWQHDVRLQTSSTVTMFDDHCCQLTGGGTYVDATGALAGARAEARPGRPHGDARCAVRPGEGFESDYMGDTQPLANGNVFVGWGSEPYFSEYSRSGKLLFEGELPGPDLSYRATLEQWVGLPLTSPRARPGARAGDDGVRELERRHAGAAWRVLGSRERRRADEGAPREPAQVRLRDRDRGARGLHELRGAGARRRRARARHLRRLQLRPPARA